MAKQRYLRLPTFFVILMLILSACGESQSGGTGQSDQPTAQSTPGATTEVAPAEGAAPTATAAEGAATGGDTAATAAQDKSSDRAPQPEAGEGMIEKLDMGGFGGGSNPQINYNPYSPNALTYAYTFEPLLVWNQFGCEPNPWLATDYEWSDSQTLVFTIRDGVKWNDGQPFSAEDVVFTFNQAKAQSALDTLGIWQALDSVAAEGNKVTFKFQAPAAQMFQRVSSYLIVPKHIWEKEADPVKFTNEGAVGTGPFKPTSFNQRQLVLSRNESYWQADKVRVNQLVFHKGEGNQVEQLKLARGEYDTQGTFVPNIEEVYVAKDPKNNHYWYAPGGAIGLGMNHKKAPFNDLEFRRAMAYAINKDEIVTKAQLSYVTKASQTGLVLPGQKDFLPDGLEYPDGVFPYDPDKAVQILEAAGYKKDANGKILGKDGKPVEFTFLVQNGWTDWIQAGQIIQQNLNAIGLTVNLQTPEASQVESQRKAANYDMLFIVHGGSCTMYDNYYNHLHSKSPTTGNYIFWSDPKTDELIEKLRAAIDPEEQKTVVKDLAKLSVEQFPTVPLWYGANWFQFSTKRATGWPDAKNPYAKSTDPLLIITNLKPAKGQ
jgi:peptide/nickel transport system substrate-binding protein